MNKKPPPLYPQAARALCPVCGVASYSHEGIHPQCAMHVADQIHIDRLKAGQFGLPAAEIERSPRFNRAETCEKPDDDSASEN